jgi:hypothetical protein
MLDWKEVKEKWNTAKEEVKAERESKIDAEIKFLSEKRKSELSKRADAERFAMKKQKLAKLRSEYSVWGKVGKVVKSSVPKAIKRRDTGNSVFGGFGNGAGDSFTLGKINAPVIHKRKHHKSKRSRHKRKSSVRVTERRTSYNPFGNAPF